MRRLLCPLLVTATTASTSYSVKAAFSSTSVLLGKAHQQRKEWFRDRGGSRKTHDNISPRRDKNNYRPSKRLRERRRTPSSDKRSTRNINDPLPLPQQPFQYLLIVDFEATCDHNNTNWAHEIIEFPICVVCTSTKKIVAEYHSFVKPVKNKILTRFCTELTGISQEQVDTAPTLPEVLLDVRKWLRRMFLPPKSALPVQATANPPPPSLAAFDPNVPTTLVEDGEEKNLADLEFSEYLTKNNICCIATDGPWDMRRFMLECSVLRDGITFPNLFYSFINVRNAYATHFKTKRTGGLSNMLKQQGLEFQGTLHSGKDDTRNIARLAILLLERGNVLKKVHRVSSSSSFASEGVANTK